MGEVVYILCLLTSLLVAFLLLRAYVRTRQRILLWCGLGFVGMGLNNLGLVIDMILLPEAEIAIYRQLPALVGLSLMVFGLIWDSD